MNYQIIIPARGGSKRLPGKNTLDLSGKPLIAHTIEFALANSKGTDVYVNTDSESIAEISKKFGARVIMRPEELGKDNTSTLAVLQNNLKYFKNNNISCDAIILLQATNPIREKGLIEKSIVAFEESGRDSLATFSLLNKKFGTISFKEIYQPENYFPGQRMQDIKPHYYEDGVIYITKVEAIQKGAIVTKDVYPLVNSHIGGQVDIDEPSDLLFAKFIIENEKI